MGEKGDNMKYKGKRIVWLTIIAMLLVMGVTVQAREIKAAESQPMEIRLYLGQSITLHELSEQEWIVSESGVVQITDKGTVTAIKKGKTTISLKEGQEKKRYVKIEVIANEKLDSLVFTKQSFPKKIVGTGDFTLPIEAFTGMTCQWSSGNAGIARVTDNGVITPYRAGFVDLYVKVTDEYGGQYRFTIPLQIVEPHFAQTTMNLAKGCQTMLPIIDASGHLVTYQTLDTTVVSLVNYNSTGVTIKAKKVGKTTITASVDGVQFQCIINVTNPKLKTAYGFYQKKKTFTLSLSGLNKNSRPLWTSGNSSVATVNSKGRVATKKYGSTIISCQVDGKTIHYYLAISTKTAVKAMRYGYKRVGKKKYSQARRMSKNYFDCSSFVYRSYRAAGKYIVRKTNWAPVAADMAKYYVRKKKNIKASGAYNEKKLRPGDLVFFGGSSAKRNGRYKRIYHVAIYIGNGRTMESSSASNNVVIRERGTLKKSGIPVVARP